MIRSKRWGKNSPRPGAAQRGRAGPSLLWLPAGELLTASYSDYAMPLAADFRNIAVIALESQAQFHGTDALREPPPQPPSQAGEGVKMAVPQ
jgi:hypothetical protein